jgi:hypothetical protein
MRISRQDLARMRQAMILGTARQPLIPPPSLAPLLATAEPGTDPARIALALAAQRLRFERPAAGQAAPAPMAAQQLHADARPIIQPPVRRALTRLSNAVAKGDAARVMQAAVARIAAAGQRPHPFDLPWLMPHIKGNADCLGLAERAYLSLTEKAATTDQPSLLHAQITPDNWGDFPKGHRRAFLMQQRSADPAAARALLENVWKAEQAPVRCELLEALAVGLSTDDQPFLEGLAGDRADSVKAVATRLIARVPGTPAHSARLAEAAACFQKASGVKSLMSRIGLGGSAGAVTFVSPKGSMTGQSAATQQAAATAALFDGLGLDDLATATGCSSTQLLAAVGDDDTVIAALMAAAVARGDEANHTVLFDHKVLALLPGSDLHPHSLISLQAVSRSPMQASTAESLLTSSAWAGLIARLTNPETANRDYGELKYVAMLMPTSVMPRFLAAIEPVQSAGAREARTFAEFILALDTARPT